MKNLLVNFFSWGALILFCNHSSGPGNRSWRAGVKAASATSSTSLQKGYGIFTFTGNGKQRTFTAWHPFMVFPMQTTDILLLEDGGPGGAGFDFKINKQGRTEFETGYANTLVPKLLFKFFDTTGVSYIGDGMVVNVTSLTVNRLVGTFTGKFVKEKYQIKENRSPGIAQTIEVTDGKFDLHK